MSTGKLIPVAGFIRTACLTVFVHDWVLTLEDEVSLIWRRRWTRATVAYFIIRYLTFAVLLMDAYVGITNGLTGLVCMKYGISASICSIVLVIVVQGVMQLRLYLMYNRSRKILWSNVVLYCVEIVVWLVVNFELVRQQPHLRIPHYVNGSCYHLIDSRATAGAWVPTLVFESWMALQAGYRIWREPQLRGPSILASLVRDSFWYYLLVVCMMLATIVLSRINPIDPGTAASGLVTAASGIGGTRILINMRHALLVPTDDPTLAGNSTAQHAIELQVVSDSSDSHGRARHGGSSSDATRYGETPSFAL